MASNKRQMLSNIYFILNTIQGFDRLLGNLRLEKMTEFLCVRTLLISKHRAAT